MSDQAGESMTVLSIFSFSYSPIVTFPSTHSPIIQKSTAKNDLNDIPNHHTITKRSEANSSTTSLAWCGERRLRVWFSFPFFSLGISFCVLFLLYLDPAEW
jgi:hypothetical protein